MAITVILGSQWGDEGKGKLTDILAPEAQLCARAAGGHNAGHSIVANGVSYSFHLLPSGFVNPNCMNFIGSGVVFHVPSFFKELQELEDKGLPRVHDRILVSDRVHIDLQMHIAADGLEEAELGAKKIGTTNRGIGPSYAAKAGRSGIRLAEVFNPELFESKLRRLNDGYRKRFGDLFDYDVEEELARFNEYRPKLAKYVVDGVSFIRSAQESNTNIVVEGANERGFKTKRWCSSSFEQALMLDIDYGSYPFVTSSNTTLAGIIGGLALNPKNLTEIVGVVKAYTTRVGQGAFKTEDLGETGTKLQEIGREWGTSTGRRRRCGWLGNYDHYAATMYLVVVKYSTSINFYTALNLTKLDVLDTFETIKIAVAYKVDGEVLDSYPADLDILDRAEVVYHEMPGWQKPTTNAKSYYDLPKQAREYIEYIENFVGVKIKWIGTGPDRESMIKRA
ncbi:P-loop containing nucleoside triphosphate hydrolase protein [Pestalotiopsis sp. NC0098]|nr:P-loop containing nucleoside triphosphate hydrolase protein [Pestalotiopsis sp. NC0098]